MTLVSDIYENLTILYKDSDLINMTEAEIQLFAENIADIFGMPEQDGPLTYSSCIDACRSFRDAKFTSNRNDALLTIAGGVATGALGGVMGAAVGGAIGCIQAYITQERNDNIARMEYSFCLVNC